MPDGKQKFDFTDIVEEKPKGDFDFSDIVESPEKKNSLSQPIQAATTQSQSNWNTNQTVSESLKNSSQESGSETPFIEKKPLKEFEQRIQKPFLRIQNEDGSISTHRMASGEVDGKQVAFPTIVNINGKLKELPIDEAFDYAIKNNEYKEFKTQEEAQKYAEGGYKVGTPLEEQKQEFNPVNYTQYKIQETSKNALYLGKSLQENNAMMEQLKKAYENPDTPPDVKNEIGAKYNQLQMENKLQQDSFNKSQQDILKLQLDKQKLLKPELLRQEAKGGTGGFLLNSLVEGYSSTSEKMALFSLEALALINPKYAGVETREEAIKNANEAIANLGIKENTDKLKLESTTPEYIAKQKEDSFVKAGVGGLAESIFPMMTPEMSGFFASGFVDGLDNIKKANPEMSLEGQVTYATASAALTVALEKFGFSEMTGNTSVMGGLVNRMLSEQTKQGITKLSANKAVDLATKIVSGMAAEGETGATEYVGQEGLKQVSDLLSGKDAFKFEGVDNFVKNTLKSGALEAIGGGVMSSVMHSPSLIKDNNKKVVAENINKQSSELLNDINNPNVPDEAKQPLKEKVVENSQNVLTILNHDNESFNTLTPEQKEEHQKLAETIQSNTQVLNNPELSDASKEIINNENQQLKAKQEGLIKEGDAKLTIQQLNDEVSQKEGYKELLDQVKNAESEKDLDAYLKEADAKVLKSPELIDEITNKRQQLQIKINTNLNPQENATQERKIAESNIGEHQNGNEGGKTASPINSDSNVESGKVEEKITHKPISELTDEEYTDKFINSGLFNPTGDVYQERLDLGMSTAEIKKGISDIKNGKNSAPALRLKEAILKTRQTNTVPIITGTGGKTSRFNRNLSNYSSDIESAPNDLTEDEIKIANNISNKLSDAINEEGITVDNIDNLIADNAGEFPYSNEDLQTIKNYLNEQRRQETSGNVEAETTTPPSEGLGEETATEGEDENLIGIKKSETERLNEKYGFEGRPDMGSFSEEVLDKKAKEFLKNTPEGIDEIVRKATLKNEDGSPKYNMSPLEVRILKEYVSSLDAQLGVARTPALLNKLDEAVKAAQFIQHSKGQGLASLKGLGVVENSLGDWLLQMKSELNVDTLSQEEIDKVSEVHDKYLKAEKEYTEGASDLTEKYFDKSAEREIEALRKEVERLKKERKERRFRTAADKTAERLTRFLTKSPESITLKDKDGNDVIFDEGEISKNGISRNDLVKLIADGIRVAGTGADAINNAVQYVVGKVQDSDWYKKLDSNIQNEFKKKIADSINENAKAEYAELVENTKESFKKIGLNEIVAKDVKAVVRSLVEQGETSLENIVDKIHTDMDGLIPKDELISIIGGKYSLKKSKSEYTNQMNQLREYAALVSKYNALLNGETIEVAAGKLSIQKREEITLIKKSIDDLEIKLGLKELPKTPEERLLDARIKRRDALREQLDNKEFESKEYAKGIVTPEIEAINAEIKQIEDEIYEAKKEAGYFASKELKIPKTAYDKENERIEKLETRLAEIESGLYEGTTKVKQEKSAEVKRLQAEIKAARKRVGLDKVFTEEELKERQLSRSLTTLEDKLKANKLEAEKKGESPTNATIKFLEAEVNKKRKEIKDARKLVGITDRNSLDNMAKRALKEAEKINEKIANSDFAPAIKRNIMTDPFVVANLPKERERVKLAVREKDNAKLEFEHLKELSELSKRGKFRKYFFDPATKTINTVGKLKATWDLSYMGVHAYYVLFTHPKLWATTFSDAANPFKKSIIWKKENYDNYISELKSDVDRWEEYRKVGLEILDYNAIKNNETEGILRRTWFDEHAINGKKVNPGKYLGTEIADRAFIAMGNIMRSSLYDMYTRELKEEGKTFETNPDEFKAAAKYANNLTGRAKAGAHFNNELVNLAIWSPAKLSSRLNMLGIGDFARLIDINKKEKDKTYKGFYSDLTPRMQKQAAYDIGKIILLGFGVMAAAAAGGADVDDDRESPTYGFIIFPNGTQWNVWGEDGSLVKAVIRIAGGGKKNALEDVSHFIRGKLAPLPAIYTDYTFEKTYMGDNIRDINGELKTSWMVEQVTPMSIKNIAEEIINDPIAGTLLAPIYITGLPIQSEKNFIQKQIEREKEKKAIDEQREYYRKYPTDEMKEQSQADKDKKEEKKNKLEQAAFKYGIGMP